MRNRRKLLWILFACALAAVLILTLWPEREPQYEGRSLSEWVILLPGLDSHDEAQRVIRHIGTNAVPFLLKWFPYHQPAWRKHLEAFSYRLPSKFRSRVQRFAMGRGSDRETGAVIALYKLGPDARSALPALARILSTEPRSAEMAAILLTNLGDEALPPLLGTLTNRVSPSRLAVVDAIGRHETKITFNEAVAAALVGCLEDKDRVLAVHAAGILCLHGIKREAVMRTFVAALNSNDMRAREDVILPLRTCLLEDFSTAALLEFLQDTNSPLSPYAAEALRNSESALPALTNSLHDPRPSVRASVAISLGGFTESAELAVPALLDAFTDTDLDVRRSATNALFRLPNYSVLEEVDSYEMIKAVLQAGLKDQALEKTFSAENLLPSLAKLLNHRDVRIRQMATNALEKIQAVDQRPAH